MPTENFKWILPNGTQILNQNLQISQVTNQNSGQYQLEISNNSCKNDIIFNVTVSEITSFQIIENCNNNLKTLEIAIQNIDNFIVNWSGPNNFTVNNTNQINVSNLQPGTYSAIVSDNLNCSKQVNYVLENTNCIIPKGISPNSDNLNDTFDLSGFKIKNLKIFNRYGVNVYTKNNYKNEWYGQDYNENILPTGTYYYLIVFPDDTIKSGWVHINR